LSKNAWHDDLPFCSGLFLESVCLDHACADYIEKHGPCVGGPLHHGGFPRMRTFRYGYDQTTGKFECYSTKATIILSDMSTIEKGPFAVIP
jgi:hypothetical protein